VILKVGMKVHTKVGDGVLIEISGGLATVKVDDLRQNQMAPYYVAPLSVVEEYNGGASVSDLERVMKHYASDQDAGYEVPWSDDMAQQITDAMRSLYPQHPAWSQPRAIQQSDTIEWGAERALYSRQLQDANKRIHELEQELLKLREQLKAQSGQTVSVPLSAWNKLCAEAAKARPLAEEEPEVFPARALRFSA
jgi:hypothetical protein